MFYHCNKHTVMFLVHCLLWTIVITRISCVQDKNLCPCTSKLLPTTSLNFTSQKTPKLNFTLKGTKDPKLLNNSHTELKVLMSETIDAYRKLKTNIVENEHYRLCILNNTNISYKIQEKKNKTSRNWKHTIPKDFEILSKLRKDLADIAKTLEAKQNTLASKNIMNAALHHLGKSLCRLEFMSYYTKRKVTCDVVGKTGRRHHRSVPLGTTSCTRIVKQGNVVFEGLQLLEQLDQHYFKKEIKRVREKKNGGDKKSVKSKTDKQKKKRNKKNRTGFKSLK